MVFYLCGTIFLSMFQGFISYMCNHKSLITYICLVQNILCIFYVFTFISIRCDDPCMFALLWIVFMMLCCTVNFFSNMCSIFKHLQFSISSFYHLQIYSYSLWMPIDFCFECKGFVIGGTRLLISSIFVFYYECWPGSFL